MKEEFYTPKPLIHLDLSIKGNRPIFACIAGVNDNFDGKIIGQEVNQKMRLDVRDIAIKDGYVHNVDYSGDPKSLKQEGFLNGGHETYTISPIDSKNKFSEGLYDCTGLIVAGIDKNTGENISFSSHQDPKVFLRRKDMKNRFVGDLRKRTNELKDRCLPGSVDAVIIGGIYDKKSVNNAIYRKNYPDSLKFISGEMRNILGFEPVVVNGPKITPGADHYFYENKNRRLYFVRPHVNPKVADFLPGDIDKVRENFS